ncbi:MAG: hypothetical protein H0W61_16075 [Bacteroidetes bacterium]|nr:hypothetical protein [Bacteroidota bacterium]
MKILVKPIFLLNVLVALLFISCSYEQIKNEGSEVNIVQLKKKYRINLPEDHTKGYIWQLSDDYNRKIIDHINTVWHGNTKGVDFNFNTLSSGSTTLTFVLRKYNDTTSIKHFPVQIQ